MSILVTTTNTGTFKASAKPKCSFAMPTTPAFAPTYFLKKDRRMLADCLKYTL